MVFGEGVLLAVLLHHGGDLNGEHTGGGGGVVEGDIQRAALAQRVALVALTLIHADDGAADGVGQGLDGGIGVLAVEEGGGQVELLVGDGVAVPQTMLEMPSFRLSPTHTGEVTARSPSPR